MFCLKVPKETVYLQFAKKLFQSFAPLNERDLLPLSVLFW